MTVPRPTMSASRRWTPACLPIALALLGLTGCGSLDATKVEGAVKDNITKTVGTDLRAVECPEDVAQERGRNFSCTAVGADGSRAPVPVTQKDDQGNVSWKIGLLRPRLVEQRARQLVQDNLRAGVRATIESTSCPDVRPVRKGDAFTCQVLFSDGDRVPVRVEQTNNAGSVNLRIVE